MARFLVVDDNPLNLEALREMVTSYGHTVISATNGVEALALAQAEPPDILISDILMPVMDGYSLCRAWMQNTALQAIPFIFYSATYTGKEDVELAYSLGATHFIEKPTEAAIFWETVNGVLDARGAGQLPIPQPALEETAFLRNYNVVLVQKLEKKIRDLETANRALEIEAAERQKLLEQLRQNEQRLSNIISAIPFGLHLYRLESDTRLVFEGANPAANDILGMDNARFIGLTIEEAFPALAGTEVPVQYRRVAAIGGVWYNEQVVYEDQRIAGAYEVWAFQVEPGRMAALFTDITARKQAEQTLHHERTLIDRIAETSPVGITVVDAEGKIIFANAKAEKVLGLTKNEIATRTYNAPEWRITTYDGEPFPESELPFIQIKALRKAIYDVRHAIEHPDGQRRLLTINAGPLFNEQHEFDGMVAMIEDVTERVYAEQQHVAFEREKERRNALQFFLHNASHDLKTPLTTIKTSLYLLANATNPAKKQAQVEVLELQVARLEQLLEDMLSMSRLDHNASFTFAPGDVNQVVGRAVTRQEPVARSRKQTLHYETAPELPPITIDGVQLEMAITHLISNALYYTPPNGVITVRTVFDAPEMLIEIRDTGIGISQDDLPHIFDRFFRADRARSSLTGGAGLGLSIAKRIVDEHRGTITVESEVGHGSVFTVRLPIAR